jgi:hypothetical protein
MTKVRFATTCDSCGKRSEEYFSWPACRECGDDICSECDVPNCRDEEIGKTWCKACAEEEEVGDE